MGKLYKFKVFLLVCLFTLAVPLCAFAEESKSNVVEPLGAGTWDYKGEETISFAYLKYGFTGNYYATDGGNFKIDVTSYSLQSNTVNATIFINGNARDEKTLKYVNGKGTIEFSNIPKGAKVYFYITVVNYDSLNFKFFD